MRIGDARRLFCSLPPCETVRRRLRDIYAEGDVIEDSVIEEDGFLTDNAHKGAQVVRRIMTNILAVNSDASFRRVIESRQKVSKRRLAATRLPYKCYSLSFRNRETDVREHFALRLISKRDVLKGNFLLKMHRFRVLRFYDIRLHRQHRIYTFK